jgi:SAM-dependent methyltransferase
MPKDSAPPIKYKYSKSSAFYLGTKKEFFSENDALLRRAARQNEFYASQPARTRCKLCNSELPSDVDFSSHGIGYKFCTDCSHLNGIYEDTREFVERLYIADAGRDYSSSYIDENFAQRTLDIYLPKIDFLLETVPPPARALLDVGCGGGYLVYAALQRHLSARGIDVNEAMIEFGNQQLAHLVGVRPLTYVAEKAFYQSIAAADADVIVAIGVIEHLREPHQFFKAYRQSAARYLYYSVPMFSFSALLENVFADVFPRQLSGGHTHLFTEASLERMHALMRVTPLAEWRFGTDVTDLYRSVAVCLRRNGASQQVCDKLGDGLVKSIDDLQSVMDRSHFCSEIHCVVTKDPD